MRVALLGAGAGRVCGVSDYTVRLAEALEREGCTVLLPQWQWESWRVPWYAGALTAEGVNVVHAQYPAAVYRFSLAPLILLSAGRWAKVLTLHEWSQSHPLRRQMSNALALLSDLVIFTSRREERRWRAQSYLRRRGCRTGVIPIGSNITTSVASRSARQRKDEVVYFGLIRPKKGIELFLEVARQALKEELPARFLVIGETPRGCERYAAGMREMAERLGNVVWVGGREPSEAHELMSQAKIAYLPYPDGASEGRSSLLAALGAGLAVVTTWGQDTPEELRHVCVFATTAEEVLPAIRRLLVDEGLRSMLVSRGEQYVARRNWSSIARAHVALYEEVLCRRRMPR